MPADGEHIARFAGIAGIGRLSRGLGIALRVGWGTLPEWGYWSLFTLYIIDDSPHEHCEAVVMGKRLYQFVLALCSRRLAAA